MTVHRQAHEPNLNSEAISASRSHAPFRAPDPNILQRQASDPHSNVWVGASAGTGKTKVLTDRLLRLLLPRGDGSLGTPPAKILCLTYTKAGAGEMSVRLQERVSQWVIMGEQELHEDLEKLTGSPPTDQQKSAAQQLFAQLIDASEGLKIQTIHAFCQSILGRFPLECGLLPGFTLIEEREAEALLSRAQRQVLATSRKPGTPLWEAVSNLAQRLSETQLSALMKAIISERGQIIALLSRYFGATGVYTALCQSLDLIPGADEAALVQQACTDAALDVIILQPLCQELLSTDGTRMVENGKAIAAFLAADADHRPALFSHYRSAFLTQKNEIKADSHLMSKALIQRRPDLYTAMRAEAKRLQHVIQRVALQDAANTSRDLLTLAEAIIETYARFKTAAGALDYDDLIMHTRDLLTQQTPWVLYKLDQGIDHILVDEAQDTNPEQWEIIQSLYHEFFAGAGARAIQRTVFVVGDEKQSIFSFQRADPQAYISVRHDLENKVRASGQDYRSVPLDISFRTVPCVLEAVDAVFSTPAMQQGMGDQPVRHRSHRLQQGGEVVLWPLFETETAKRTDFWTPPVQSTEGQSGSVRLARHVAQKIKTWLDQGEILASRERAITPGDIMILVKSRNALMGQIARAIKNAGIPVSGLDRMVLGQQIAVQDLIAAGTFALYPNDDLALAGFLKSPLIGLDEEDLFNLCYDRPASLWESLRNSRHISVSTWLSELIVHGLHLGPYAFFSLLLETPCPADPWPLPAKFPALARAE
ncbi:MAG: UvrD-helicase domain-containing protein [Alphaproteobacteria bacterium]|nr:UvrD-helicase domain-containing protein [Alphaproteobacteria bacterium]